MSGTKEWRILVYVAASVDDPNPEGTTVDFTITSDHLLEAPRIGGQRIDVLAGGAESLSWSAVVGDFSEFFTGNMTDGQGRMNVAGRLVRAQVNVNGAGFNTVWAGRLTGAQEMDGPGKYEINFADERWKVAGTRIYETASTAQILPGGVKAAWKEFKPAGTVTAVVSDVTANDVFVNIRANNLISQSVLQLLERDLKDDHSTGPSDGSTGNFRKLRVNIGGTQREILSFGGVDDDPLAGLRDQDRESDQGIKINGFVIAWGTTQPSLGAVYEDVTLTLDGTEVSESWPLHVGGADGFDPLTEAKTHFDAEGIRYDSNVFSTWDASTNPDGLVDHPLIPRLWSRVTESADLMEWFNKMLAALGLVPFVNADGEIAPKFAFMLHDVDPTTLPEVTDDDLADAASFDFRGSELINVVETSYRETTAARLPPTGSTNAGRLAVDDDWAADRLKVREGVRVPKHEHDNVDDVGSRTHTIDASLWEFRGAVAARRFFRQQATEIFDRFGDGPIYGRIVGLAALESLAPGDWFRLTASNYPVFTTGSRDGSTLVAQVLETRLDPEGPTLRFLTGGPDDQPLAAPSVALAQNTARPEHAVDATISGLPAGADKYQLQVREGSGPWNTVAEGTANETVTIQNLPSNTQIDARVRATALSTIRSAWSTTASVTTASLAAPTGVSATASGRAITLTWTPGESDYGLMVTVDGTDHLLRPLPPGTTGFTVHNLDASTLYTLGVKHVDPYGGESALVTDTATTGTANQLSAPRGLHPRQGLFSVGNVAATGDGFGYSPGLPSATAYDLRSSPHGTGVELAWQRTEPDAVTVVEYDTDATFSNPTRISAGLADRIRISLPFDFPVQVYFFRIRHELEGYTASDWFYRYSFAGGAGTHAVNSGAYLFTAETPPPVAISHPTLTVIPGTQSGTRGFELDVHFSVQSGDINQVVVFITYNDGAAQEATEGPFAVADDGGAETIRLSQFFEESWTDITVTVVPRSITGLLTIPRTVTLEDATETGVGVRAELTAGGIALAPKFVAGSAITIDTDVNGNIQINANPGADGELGDLTNVVITGTPADNEVLAYDSGTGNWINQTAAEAGLAVAGHNHDHDSLTGFVADEHVAHSGVTITAGDGLSGGGTIAASRTIDWAPVGLTLETGAAMSGLDSLPWHDDGVGPKRTLFQNVPLSIFNNDAGFITSGFDTAGDGLSAAGSTVAVDYAAGGSNVVTAAPNTPINVVGLDAILVADGGLSGAVEAVILNTIDVGVFNDDGSYLAPGEAVTSVGAATGLDSTGGLTPSISLSFDELPDRTMAGTDKLVFYSPSGAGHFTDIASGIDVNIFDTSSLGSGFTTAGDGLVGSGSTVDVNYTGGADSVIGAAGDGLVGTLETTDRILYADDSDLFNVKFAQVGQLPFPVASANETISGAWSFNNTKIGQNQHSLVVFDAAQDFSQVSGYRTMVHSTSTQKPTGWASYYHWNVLSKRDASDGYVGIAISHGDGKAWIGENTVGSSLPNWHKILTEATATFSSSALVRLGAGSAASPAITYGDNDTGHYRSGTEVRTVVNGSVVMQVQADGTIIGTDMVATSDLRLKDVVERIMPEDALNLTRQLSPIRYRWREARRGTGLQLGLGAQEVEPWVPEAVRYNEDMDEYGLAYDKLVPLLIGAVQHLANEVDRLRAQTELV